MSRCNKLPNLQRSQTMTAENEDVAAGRPVKTVSLGNLSCGRGKPGHPTTRKTPTVQHTNRQSRTRQARTIARSGPSLRRCDYRAARPPSLVYGRPIPFMDALSKLLFGLHFPLWTPYHFLLWTQRWPTCASLGRRRELGARRERTRKAENDCRAAGGVRARFEHEPESRRGPSAACALRGAPGARGITRCAR